MRDKNMKDLCRFWRDEELKAIENMTGGEAKKETGVRFLSRQTGSLRRRRLAIAAMLAVVLLTAGITVGPTVYAQVRAWIKGTEYTAEGRAWNVFRLFSAGKQEKAADFRLGWVPERYTAMQENVGEGARYDCEYVYTEKVPWTASWPELPEGYSWAYPQPDHDDREHRLAFGYWSISEKSEEQVWFRGEGSVLEEVEWQIGRWQVYCYTYQDGTIECLGADPGIDTAFRLSGDGITREEAIRIIENITPVK